MENAAAAEPDSLHKSPLIFIRTHTTHLLDSIETIDAFAVAPWQQSLRQVVHISREREEAVKRCQNAQGREIRIFTDASMKNGKVGYSILAWVDSSAKTEMLRTIGTSDMVNVYIAGARGNNGSSRMGRQDARCLSRHMGNHGLLRQHVSAASHCEPEISKRASPDPTGCENTMGQSSKGKAPPASVGPGACGDSRQ